MKNNKEQKDFSRRDFSKHDVQLDWGLACQRLHQTGYRQDLGRKLASYYGPNLGLS